MRPNGIKLLCAIGLMVTLSVMMGCGESDLLDQETTRYAVDINPVSPTDGETITNEVDVVRKECADPDPNANQIDQPGGLFPFDVQAVIEANATAAEFRVESYDFALTPISGTYGGLQGTERILSGSQMPNLNDTPLSPRTTATSSPVIKPGSTVTLSLLIWSPGDKDYYISFLDTFPVLTNDGFSGVQTVFTYNVKVVLNCRDIEDNTFTIVGDTFIDLGNFSIEGECGDD